MTDKKTLIYNAVIDIIKDNGFNSNIKISDIAKKANIGKGTVYEYFDNKDQILSGAIINQMQKSMEELLNDKEYNELNFNESLMRLIKKTLSNFTKNYSLHCLFVSQNIGSMLNSDMKMLIKTELDEKKQEYHKVFRKIIDKGISEGILKADIDNFNIMAASNMIAISAMQFFHKNEKNYSENEFTDKLYNIILKILI